MKRQFNLSFVILLAVAMLLSACGAETETSTTAINIPAVSIGQATESNELTQWVEQNQRIQRDPWRLTPALILLEVLTVERCRNRGVAQRKA